MKRLNNWEARLKQFIDQRKNRKLSWGVTDCALVACDHILNITGIDTATKFRAKYSTKEEAYKLLEEFAGGGLINTVEKLTKHYKFEEWKNPMLAQRGDLVYCEIPTASVCPQGTLGFVDLNGNIVVAGKNKLVFLTLDKAKRAWKI